MLEGQEVSKRLNCLSECVPVSQITSFEELKRVGMIIQIK